MDGQEGPTGPPGPSGPGDIIVTCDVGGSISSDNGEIILSGECGIFTECREPNEVIFSITPQFRIYDFIVDQAGDPNCVFISLCDALAAAADAPGDGPVNIAIAPGCYTLCDMLNERIINIISLGPAPKTVKVGGNGISWGNKTWVGITFVGEECSYVLNDEGTHEPTVDLFKMCEFTDNFQIHTKHDILRFRGCFFNYNQLTRQSVMIVEGATGIFDICNCKFFVCRLGNVEVDTFMLFNSSTDATISKLFDCHWDVIIDGTNTFFLIQNKNLQLVVFNNNTWNWIRAVPAKTVLIGDAGTIVDDVRVPNINARLQFYSCKVYSQPGDTVIMLADQWTGKKDVYIEFVDCELTMAQFANYFIEPPAKTKSCWLIDRVIFQSTLDAIIWFIKFSDDNCVQMLLWYSQFTNISDNDMIRFEESGTGNMVTLEAVKDYFRSTAAPTPPTWLDVTTLGAAVTVLHNGIVRNNVDPAVGGPTLVALPTGP